MPGSMVCALAFGMKMQTGLKVFCMANIIRVVRTLEDVNTPGHAGYVPLDLIMKVFRPAMDT